MIHSDLTEKKLMEVKKTLDIDSMVIITVFPECMLEFIVNLFMLTFFELCKFEQDVDIIETQMSKGIEFQKMGK